LGSHDYSNANAKKINLLEVYILIDDEIGNRFFEILEKKTQEGLEVKLVLDYWEVFGFPKKRFRN
jgi:cardiolipin synthase